jgi:molybdenum cofactor biosynthesis protein B
MSDTTPNNKPPATARCVVLSICDTMSVDHDTNGKVIESLLHEKGHEVTYRRIIKNKGAAIQEAIAEAIADDECDVILTTGGTGISRKDQTFKTLSRLYEEPIPGFSELFHQLAYLEIGSACLLSRASAGIIEGHVVFSLPGSSGAVRLAMEELILPELSHILDEFGAQ